MNKYHRLYIALPEVVNGFSVEKLLAWKVVPEMSKNKYYFSNSDL